MEQPDIGDDRSDGRRERGNGNRGGRGDNRDGPRGSGVRGGGKDKDGANRVLVEPFRHPGIFIARLQGSDMLVTRSMVVGESVYDEERISVDGDNQEKIEYRQWNPFRSKLCAAIIGGIERIHILPGTKVLYLGAASGITVSHVSDIVGPDGLVYAVEFSEQFSQDLLNLAKKRTNIIPIIEDARHPEKYQILVGMVDTIFADVNQPDQVHILALNAHQFLKNGGHFVIATDARCIDSTAVSERVFAGEIIKLRNEKLKPHEQITLEPYERDHVVVVGVYQPDDRSKNTEE